MSKFKDALEECRQSPVAADPREPGGKTGRPLGAILIGAVIVIATVFPLLGIIFMDTTDESTYRPKKVEHKGALSEKTSKIAEDTFESALNNGLGKSYNEDHCLRLEGGEVAAGLTGSDKKIQIVWLSGCPVDRELINKISLYPEVNRIYLEKCHLGPGALQHLAKLATRQSQPGLEGLSKLWLVDCGLNGEDLAPVASIKNLEQLNLSKNRGLTARSMSLLARLPRLKSLTANSCDLDDSDMKAIAAIASLEHLYIRDNPQITPAGLEPFRNRKTLGIHVEDRGVFEERKLESIREKFGVNIQ